MFTKFYSFSIDILRRIYGKTPWQAKLYIYLLQKHGMRNAWQMLSKVKHATSYDFTRQSQDKRRKILIAGAYGVPNFGDELMLNNIVELCHQKYGDTINLYAMLNRSELYNIDQWKAINICYAPQDMKQVQYLAGWFDEIIFGGGALIDDRFYDDSSSSRLQRHNIQVLELAEAMILQGKVVKFIGVSTSNIIKNKKYIQRLNNILEHAAVVTTRDDISIESLRQLGIDTSRIHSISDPAYAMNGRTIHVGLTLEEWDDKYGMKKILPEFIHDFALYSKKNDMELQLMLLPFRGDSRTKFIYSKYARMIEEAGLKVIICPSYDNIDSMLLMIKGCDCMINLLYHATLLGDYYYKPTTSICCDSHPHYYNKMTYLHRQTGNEKIIYASQYNSITLYRMLDQMLSNTVMNGNDDISQKACRQILELL